MDLETSGVVEMKTPFGTLADCVLPQPIGPVTIRKVQNGYVLLIDHKEYVAVSLEGVMILLKKWSK